uniref:Fucosyltransferase n=1 Tax=Panagrellus redivivus TaxID=6233 RepID=A0A7E4VR68_PANRE
MLLRNVTIALNCMIFLSVAVFLIWDAYFTTGASSVLKVIKNPSNSKSSTKKLPNSKKLTIKMSSDATKLPTILEWNPAPWANESRLTSIQSCSFKCTYTTNRRLVNDAHLTIYHMGADKCAMAPQPKNTSGLNVFLNMEAPVHRPFYKYVPTDFFDFTVTYRQDSDIPLFYDKLVKLDGKKDNDRWKDSEVKTAISKKVDSVLWFVSHCNTASMREIYVEELKMHINVNQFGSCNNNGCTKKCADEKINSHYFYLSLENSVCNDYITEKYFRMRKLIVPIVFDRRVFRGIHTNLINYTIFASDYESPKHLANYLKYLIAHPKEYQKYFEWTKIYKKSPQQYFPPSVWCQMCKVAHQVQDGSYQKKPFNIYNWWGSKMCYGAVGRDLAFKGKKIDHTKIDLSFIDMLVRNEFIRNLIKRAAPNRKAMRNTLNSYYQLFLKSSDPNMKHKICYVLEELDRTFQTIP